MRRSPEAFGRAVLISPTVDRRGRNPVARAERSSSDGSPVHWEYPLTIERRRLLPGPGAGTPVRVAARRCGSTERMEEP
jgi:hypothetical protein